MATVRFFAQAREAAGTGTATISGANVGAVLDSAIAQYGAQFEAVLGMSKVWLNGEEVSREQTYERCLPMEHQVHASANAR